MHSNWITSLWCWYVALKWYSNNLRCINLWHILVIDILSISSEIALRWLPQYCTHNKSTFLQLVAWCHWRQPGGKPLSEPMMVSLLTHICITQPQWIKLGNHYNDVLKSTMASQITSLMIVNSSVYSGADQRKHQSSASLAFVRGIHRWLVNSLYKWPVTRKMFPFDAVIMYGWIIKLISINPPRTLFIYKYFVVYTVYPEL